MKAAGIAVSLWPCMEKTVIIYFGQNVKVYLFGSRVYPDQRGVDIDLFLESVPKELISIEKKIAFIADLKKNFRGQKIDMVLKS